MLEIRPDQLDALSEARRKAYNCERGQTISNLNLYVHRPHINTLKCNSINSGDHP